MQNFVKMGVGQSQLSSAEHSVSPPASYSTPPTSYSNPRSHNSPTTSTSGEHYSPRVREMLGKMEQDIEIDNMDKDGAKLAKWMKVKIYLFINVI